MITTSETPNFELFRDCLSPSLIQKFASSSPTRKAKRKGDRRDGRKKSRTLTRENGIEDDGNGGDAEELSEFVDVNVPDSLLMINTDDNTTVHCHRNLPRPFSRPPHINIHNLYELCRSPKPLYRSSIFLSNSRHPLQPRSLDNRNPYYLRAPPCPLHSRRPHCPHPVLISLSHNRAPTFTIADQGPSYRLRDLPPVARPADIPPSYPADGA